MSAGVQATRGLLDELKIKPAIVDLPVEFRKDDAAFRASLPKLEEAAPFAVAIGCPRMITWLMSSSPMPKDELRRVFLTRPWTENYQPAPQPLRPTPESFALTRVSIQSSSGKR